jgi:hypothetical protein
VDASGKDKLFEEMGPIEVKSKEGLPKRKVSKKKSDPDVISKKKEPEIIKKKESEVKLKSFYFP